MKTRGFTLIELMVVVLIIGLLASAVVLNVNKSRKQGRDAKRISDLNTVASALESYYADKHQYPISQILAVPYPGSKRNYEDMVQEELIGNSNNYLKSIPRDPLGNIGDFGYRYSTNDIGSEYNLAVHLETDKGKTGVMPEGCGNPQFPPGPEYRLSNGEPINPGTDCSSFIGPIPA